ncbi:MULTISPECIES: acetoacetate--CoA ligase [unclassified Oleiphilus]|uniref:acetoacetate--CoA ligase n=2 Tax=Oleiphilus TaxID=141450 RepID=UPI0007C33DC9|nr:MULTISPECIES: acetoacetate--CoA ligase [unclassified Oleiphilus]KZY48450.1 acetoacetyl-CoA synthetase [Oleiphilus sp. HI0050]KZZ35618.1 acetoacetyl-CoA synthetase [Oleiphilus sp. HI0117]KZZ36794.1 acetoacetyl-CoA synthetase [Oleiphilus sp. HI0086]
MNQQNNECLWQPSIDRISQTELTRFMSYLNQQSEHSFESYDQLYRWSVSDKQAFWSQLWDFFDVKGHKGELTLLNEDKMPGAQWFPNATLNFAENLLRQAESSPASIAIVERGEHGLRTELSYQELLQQVNKCATYLKQVGVAKGDVVAGFLPNSCYAVIAMLATSSLGAIWTSCSPDFGVTGVLDRFEQTRPKVLFATDGYYYGNKTISSLERVKAVQKGLSELEACILIPYLKPKDSDKEALGDSFHTWADVMKVEDNSALSFTQMPFSAPLYILYSSGTTGKPKCIVHSAGGTLIQHLKELALHTNVKPNTKLFYYTTCGWMMWNWLVSGLALGATLVLYDGSPFHPEQTSLLDIADEEGIDIFGASAKYYAACEKFGLSPKHSHQLDSVEAFLSTGSPLSHESFEYIYRDIKTDVCVSSISGGTDIISCFALGNPNLPVYKGELQCIGLGMDVQFLDDDGTSLTQGKGELVCKQAFPSMPTCFWNDKNNEKYQSAYFKRFDNTWAHGDYGELIVHEADNGTPTQTGVIIHGRSDAILNPGGVRIGTAEIYRQVEKVEEVFESIAIGQEWQDDVRVILFVRLQEGLTLDTQLIDKIKRSIRENTTPRHVPNKILQVTDIPRTLSGKIVELAVRNVVHGKELTNIEALANPEALNLYSNLAALKSD